MPKLKADVTAIIPVYNGKLYLRQAVESVLSQTVLPKELIIIDDGSTDDSISTIKGIRSKIPITVEKQKNSGQAAARNKGINLSKTEFVALLDQDDFWYPQHIELLIKPLLEDPSAGWSYSNIDQVLIDGTTLNQDLFNHLDIEHPKTQLYMCLSQDMYILPSASILRKSAVQSIGGFDERLSGYEDDDLFLRLFIKGWRNVYISRSLSAWRIHSTSTMFSKNMMNSRRIYADKLLNMFPDKPDLNVYFARDCIAPRFYKMVQEEYLRGIRIKNDELCKESLIDMKKYSLYYNRGFKRKCYHFLMSYPGLFNQLNKVISRLL